MKKIFVFIIAAMSIASCAQKTWVKAGATEETFQRDNLTCRQYGMQSATAHGMTDNMFVEMWIQDETTRCLNNLGYRQVDASSINKMPVSSEQSLEYRKRGAEFIQKNINKPTEYDSELLREGE